MAYKHVIRAKTKNLFDISKIVESTNLKNNKDGTITVSVYGVSGGLLKNLCPELKVGDVIKVYFQPLRWTAPNPPLVMVVGDVIFDRNGNSRLTVTEKSLNKPVLFYNNHYDERGLPGTTIIGNILITTDLTITNKNHNERYTPYNYLQSNKRMIKVSNVCQLLDKSKFSATQTVHRVTFTNNGDGTITVNGTNNGEIYYNLEVLTSIPVGHKVIIDDRNSTLYFFGDMRTKDNVLIGTISPRTIFTLPSNLARLNMLYFVRYDTGGVTYNNELSRPQLFDLTEMYGAGHEPATVAEFRQRFPNELYPYSPQCWLTSYKSAVVCKTKNLFDVNNAVPYTFYNDNPGSNLLWLKDGIYTTRINNYNQGNGLRIKDGWKLPAGVYTLSVKVVDCSDFGTGGYANIGFYYKIADGTWHVLNGPRYSYTPGTTLSFAINIPEHLELRLYLNYQNMNGRWLTGYVSYKDIQLEQGPTATSYVPYQHL